ncbi:hypothetical protein GGG16DRAFT_119733 [Schizophyllum commune]
MPFSDTTPRSSSDAVAVVLRMLLTRGSQAWETRGSVLGAMMRPVRSWGEDLGPSLAMPNELGHRHRRYCSCRPRAAESERGHPSMKVAEEVGYLRRRAGLKGGAACLQIHEELFTGPKPPEACAGALGEGCEWGGLPLPPHYEQFSQTTKRPMPGWARSAEI